MVQTMLDKRGPWRLVVNNGRHIGPGLMDTILDMPIDEHAHFLQARLSRSRRGPATNSIRLEPALAKR